MLSLNGEMEDNRSDELHSREPLLFADESCHHVGEKAGSLGHDESSWVGFSFGKELHILQKRQTALTVAGSVLGALLVALAALWLGYALGARSSPSSAMAPPRNSITFSNGTVYQRPPSLRIVGLIFCTSPVQHVRPSC